MRKMVRKIAVVLAILVLVVVVGFGWLIWMAQQQARHPNVSIAFVGYTNDSSGVRFGRFAISNHDAAAVERISPIMEIQTTGTGYGTSLGSGVIGGRESETLVVRSPTNESWRLALRLYPDIGTVRTIKRLAVEASCLVRLRPRYQTMPFSTRSEWIDSANGVHTNGDRL
jgi:hypothetical protein